MQRIPLLQTDRTLATRLRRAAEVAGADFAAICDSRYGLSLADWQVLRALSDGPASAAEICTATGMHKTRVSRAVAGLTRRRALARSRETRDRRYETLRLSDRGTAMLHDLTAEATRLDDALRARLADPQAFEAELDALTR